MWMESCVAVIETAASHEMIRLAFDEALR